MIGDGHVAWTCPNCGETRTPPEYGRRSFADERIHAQWRERTQRDHAANWCRPVSRPRRRASTG